MNGRGLGSRRLPRIVALLLLVTLGQGAVAARAFAQTLTILASPTTPLSVSTAIAGAQPDASTEDASTTYSAVVLLLTSKIIVAKLSAPLPSGVTLKVKLAAATSPSISPGYVDLDIGDRTVLSNLAGGATGRAFSGTITYQLVSTVAASPFTNTVDVVFTLKDP